MQTGNACMLFSGLLAGLSTVLVLLAGYVMAQPLQQQPLPWRHDANLTIGHYQWAIMQAKTLTEYSTGLMHQRTWPVDRGMWFAQEKPDYQSLWMANCHVPLDFVFIRGGQINQIMPQVPPCPTARDCPVYTSSQAVDGVIELLAGQAKRHQLHVGQSIRITFLR
jgi:uncharacterized membrane protein (UPF0127 family)